MPHVPTSARAADPTAASVALGSSLGCLDDRYGHSSLQPGSSNHPSGSSTWGASDVPESAAATASSAVTSIHLPLAALSLGGGRMAVVREGPAGICTGPPASSIGRSGSCTRANSSRWRGQCPHRMGWSSAGRGWEPAVVRTEGGCSVRSTFSSKVRERGHRMPATDRKPGPRSKPPASSGGAGPADCSYPGKFSPAVRGPRRGAPGDHRAGGTP